MIISRPLATTGLHKFYFKMLTYGDGKIRTTIMQKDLETGMDIFKNFSDYLGKPMTGKVICR